MPSLFGPAESQRPDRFLRDPEGSPASSNFDRQEGASGPDANRIRFQPTAGSGLQNTRPSVNQPLESPQSVLAAEQRDRRFRLKFPKEA